MSRSSHGHHQQSSPPPSATRRLGVQRDRCRLFPCHHYNNIYFQQSPTQVLCRKINHATQRVVAERRAWCGDKAAASILASTIWHDTTLCTTGRPTAAANTVIRSTAPDMLSLHNSQGAAHAASGPRTKSLRSPSPMLGRSPSGSLLISVSKPCTPPAYSPMSNNRNDEEASRAASLADNRPAADRKAALCLLALRQQETPAYNATTGAGNSTGLSQALSCADTSEAQPWRCGAGTLTHGASAPHADLSLPVAHVQPISPPLPRQSQEDGYMPGHLKALAAIEPLLTIDNTCLHTLAQQCLRQLRVHRRNHLRGLRRFARCSAIDQALEQRGYPRVIVANLGQQQPVGSFALQHALELRSTYIAGQLQGVSAPRVVERIAEGLNAESRTAAAMTYWKQLGLPAHWKSEAFHGSMPANSVLRADAAARLFLRHIAGYTLTAQELSLVCLPAPMAAQADRGFRGCETSRVPLSDEDIDEAREEQGMHFAEAGLAAAEVHARVHGYAGNLLTEGGTCYYLPVKEGLTSHMAVLSGLDVQAMLTLPLLEKALRGNVMEIRRRADIVTVQPGALRPSGL